MAGTNSLPRVARLVGADNYRLAFASRRSLKGRWLSLHLRQRDDAEGGARIGLVVGKRFCRLATRRNFLKRIVREQFRCARNALGPVDLVVRLVRTLPPRFERETRASLHQDIASLVVKLKQLHRRST